MTTSPVQVMVPLPQLPRKYETTKIIGTDNCTNYLETTSKLPRNRDKNWHADRRKNTMGKLSKQNVGQLHFLIADKLNLLMGRVEKSTKGKSVNAFAGWRSMTLDIISTFAFGTCLDSLHDIELNHYMLDTMESALSAFYMVSYYSEAFIW